ncbi:MAG TPA: hypothetical protein G4N95_09260, partial [Anaerolineae bacterium]|nr:hypothetical protein [Anaerolineae bacterium]
RERVKKFLSEVKQEGYKDVRLVGNGDIAEICRLTCLEAGINIEDAPNIPTLEIQGWKVYLTWSEPHD